MVKLLVIDAIYILTVFSFDALWFCYNFAVALRS